MELYSFLNGKKDDIINEASVSLSRAQLEHYDSSGEAVNRERLLKLFLLTLECVHTKSLLPINNYSEKIAEERFNKGFDFHEVHTAFNVLEEAMWKQVTNNFVSAEMAEALGMVSTILGAGKQTLASVYISLAAKTKRTSLDVSALFRR